LPTSGPSRTYTIAAAVTGLLMVAGIGVVSALRATDAGASRSPTVAQTSSQHSSPRSAPTSGKPKASQTDPLTGGAVNNNPVIAVKVENTAAARPQVGLPAADIVFVQEVEGGQTRLISVYHTRFPKRVGPVRSARTTDALLLPVFGKPGLVYSGANRRVQRKINSASVVPILRTTRDSRRRAPHNVFVNLQGISASTNIGKAEPIGWIFRAEDGRWADAATAKTIKTRVGHDTFAFEHDTRGYLVRWNGQRYADGDSGRLVRADNIVIMRVRNRPDGNRDVNGVPSVRSEPVGQGPVTIHRGGKKLSGSWKRLSLSAPLQFVDKWGKEISLHPGRTWVTLSG
jgi:Protein of unknown function (DUF3048) N-terminal domain/Protein of unknown function (DUF3048) C-terminal domain